MNIVDINGIKVGGNNPFTLLAGPCVVEGEEITLKTAERIKEITLKLDIPFVFKSSYKKANRTNISSFTGIGNEKALKVLGKVKAELDVPVVTDIHTEQEAEEAAEYVDILQIPAFLCRQTDLLVAAGNTGKVVNIKKGQFLAPWSMEHAVQKVESTGNKKIMLTERGSTFGYNNLVVDMRGLLLMRDIGYPVVMDATHSVQMPGTGTTTGGDPRFIHPLAKAAMAVGVDALFLEVHPDPENAKSDAASQLQLDKLESLLVSIKKINEIVLEERTTG